MTTIFFLALLGQVGAGPSPGIKKIDHDDSLQQVLNGEKSPAQYHVNDDDEPLKAKRKQLINCLYAECDTLESYVAAGGGAEIQLLDAQARLAKARFEYHQSDPKKQLEALRDQLSTFKKLERRLQQRSELVSRQSLMYAVERRLQVEVAIGAFEQQLLDAATESAPKQNAPHQNCSCPSRTRSRLFRRR